MPSALHVAFRLTNLEVVKMLGAKVDAINERGIALLLWACVAGEFEIMNSVLDSTVGEGLKSQCHG